MNLSRSNLYNIHHWFFLEVFEWTVRYFRFWILPWIHFRDC